MEVYSTQCSHDINKVFNHAKLAATCKLTRWFVFKDTITNLYFTSDDNSISNNTTIIVGEINRNYKKELSVC